MPASAAVAKFAMDDQTLARLRPRDDATAEIARAISSLQLEQAAAQERLESLKAARDALMLSGTTAELRANADAVADAETDLQQLSAMAGALDKACAAAGAREAAAAFTRQFDETVAAIERASAWFAKYYRKHADALAEGLALEADAAHRRAVLVQVYNRGSHSAASPAGLPLMPRAYVGNEWRSFGALVKLPGTAEGAPIHWGDPFPFGR